MRHKYLTQIDQDRPVRKSGSVPANWAVRTLGCVILLACVLVTLGCKDEYPGLTAEELQSDSLPEFDDATFAGTWISEGEYVLFEVKEHGFYLLRSPEDENDEEKEEPIPFRLKRTGDLLILEYSMETDSGHVYRPCVISIKEQAMELDCLVADELFKMGVEFETQKAGSDELKVIRESQKRLKEFYREQANNPKVFEPTIRMTRPQPARMARLGKQALRGSSEAQEMLARAYQAGEIVARNREEASKWARKAAEAERPSAQVLYGDILRDESRAHQNTTESENIQQEALLWYQRAAEQKYPRAFGRLGHLYEEWAYKDESSAVDNYKRGAELGDADSTAQLGIRYYYGTGVPKDERAALRYLEAVPESEREARAWDTLARIYLDTLEPEQRDAKKARHAAEQAVIDFRGSDGLELLARAAFKNEQYAQAVKYQAEAISMGGDRLEERKETLAYYQMLVPGGVQVTATTISDRKDRSAAF
jgi:TPR repeat protein